jgi:hypothetical protein
VCGFFIQNSKEFRVPLSTDNGTIGFSDKLAVLSKNKKRTKKKTNSNPTHGQPRHLV